jgi:hypothetical protein
MININLMFISFININFDEISFDLDIHLLNVDISFENDILLLCV